MPIECIYCRNEIRQGDNCTYDNGRFVQYYSISFSNACKEYARNNNSDHLSLNSTEFARLVPQDMYNSLRTTSSIQKVNKQIHHKY